MFYTKTRQIKAINSQKRHILLMPCRQTARQQAANWFEHVEATET